MVLEQGLRICLNDENNKWLPCKKYKKQIKIKQSNIHRLNNELRKLNYVATVGKTNGWGKPV